MQCTFSEDKGEKLLIEKNLQSFATYCFLSLIQILIENNKKLTIEEEPTMALIQLEDNDEIKITKIEQFNETMNYLKEFFEVLNKYVLSRIMNIQKSSDK